jgi:hypothetical protein
MRGSGENQCGDSTDLPGSANARPLRVPVVKDANSLPAGRDAFLKAQVLARPEVAAGVDQGLGVIVAAGGFDGGS